MLTISANSYVEDPEMSVNENLTCNGMSYIHPSLPSPNKT